MEEFDVRGASELVPIKALSGGNQQKAIIAREIDRNPDLFIVSQPTRGLDVGAIEYIRKRLIAERDKGKAVLVVSFELDEILDVSDRIAVIHDGVIHGIVEPAKTNKQELGVLMAGGHIEKEKNMLNKYKNLALPLMAVVSGILLGAIVMLVLATIQFGAMKSYSIQLLVISNQLVKFSVQWHHLFSLLSVSQ